MDFIRGTTKFGGMIAGWIEASATIYVAGEAFGGLGKAGLITIIVVSLIVIVAFVWILHETRERD